jgi:peptidoglycan-associated lipoprotein
MKTKHLLLLVTLLGTALSLQGCRRTSNDVWEDTKSAGRHMSRGIKALSGYHGDSRQIRCRDDFECIEDECCYDTPGVQDCEYGYSGPNIQDCDYIPLQDPANDEIAMADIIAPPPRETPGEPGSSLPGIQAFRDPNTIPQLAGIFRNIYFDYDSSLVKGPENLRIMHAIADYLRRNPNVYVYIEGHTDERGPQAYNLALGSRRSNAVRNLLISEGVNPHNLFTVSYGKERPVVLERHEEGWAKNRRVEFKVYAR